MLEGGAYKLCLFIHSNVRSTGITSLCLLWCVCVCVCVCLCVSVCVRVFVVMTSFLQSGAKITCSSSKSTSSERYS